MKIFDLNSYSGGWFIGDFDPSVLRTPDFEVAVKSYRAGTTEPLHHHRIATEYTVVISGAAIINNSTISAGQIIEIMPFESATFRAIEDTVTVVVKKPSAPTDKYTQPSAE